VGVSRRSAATKPEGLVGKRKDGTERGQLFPDHREVESSEEESPWAWKGVKNGLPWVRQPDAAERVTKP